MSELRGEAVVLRPTAERDVEALHRIHATPEVAAWWGSIAPGFPLSDEPTASRLTILVENEIAGLIQFTEENEPDYRHASIDIFLDPGLHRRGHGTDAVATLARHLVQHRGHHRITIDPAADNAAAIRCYEKAGFHHVGVMRKAWRDPGGTWRDALFMELVV
jgi:aminoglycoside 6'-N-acetyltransferase